MPSIRWLHPPPGVAGVWFWSMIALTMIQRDLADALRGQQPPGGTHP
jgi:hypothetical protein